MSDHRGHADLKRRGGENPEVRETKATRLLEEGGGVLSREPLSPVRLGPIDPGVSTLPQLTLQGAILSHDVGRVVLDGMLVSTSRVRLQIGLDPLPRTEPELTETLDSSRLVPNHARPSVAVLGCSDQTLRRCHCGWP